MPKRNVNLPENPTGTVYAVITHLVDITGEDSRFVELRQVRSPRMMLPYASKRLDCVFNVRMWHECYHPEVKVKWCSQEIHWDQSAGLMVYGDVFDLHLVKFPKYCNDPFWQQFANPLMAYSGHGLSYDYWLTNRLPKPCGTDHTDFFAAMAMRANEMFETLPNVKQIIKEFNQAFKETRL